MDFKTNLVAVFLLSYFLLLCPAFTSEPMDLNNKGVEAYNQRDYEEAVKLLSQAFSLAPNNETVRKNLINALQSLADERARNNNYREAVNLVNDALKLDDTNYLAHLQLGAFLLNSGQLMEAIRHLEMAVKLKPGYLDAHELLGEAYYRDNDILSAKTQWEYVLEMDPKRKELKERYDKACREEVVEKSFNKTISHSRHFNLTYPKEVNYQIRSQVLSVLERAFLEVGRKLGGVFPNGPIQVILYDMEQFNAVVQLGQTVGGVYDGKIRIPVIKDKDTVLPDDEIKRRIYHEYVHVAVYEILKDKAPWWVNEGLAETLSKDFTEREKKTLIDAINNNKLLPFKVLEKVDVNEVFASDSKVSIAYTQSHLAVNMLWNKYGQGRFLNFLQSLKQIEEPEEALAATYRIDYRGLTKGIIQYVQK